MGMQAKDLRKICGELKAARLIFSHSKSEMKEGSNRATTRDYYYIPFHHVIDSIKYRIYKLTSNIKASYIPSTERKALHCPQCDASYTELEAMPYFSDEGFICERCRHLLENEDETKVADQSGFEKQSRLMAELEKLLQLLKQIDAVDIPSNEFDDAWSVKVEVKRPEATVRPKFPGQPTNAPVRGAVGSTDAANLSISISTTAELTAAQEAEDAKLKAELLAKNQAPEWFKTSAVLGGAPQSSSYSQNNLNNPSSSSTESNGATKRKLEDDEEARKAAESAQADEEMNAYYAAMAQEKEQEAKESASSDDSEDDEGDFEDVNVATPPVRANGFPISSNPNRNRKDDSESVSSSAPATNTATPTDSGIDSHPRPAKRVKIMGSDRNYKPEVSDEDEEEFEDVARLRSKPPTSTGNGNRSGIGIGTSRKDDEQEDSDEDEAEFEDV
jgi:transcription initiation factor TFIIE subunit alpha